LRLGVELHPALWAADLDRHPVLPAEKPDPHRV
jgi:hypothetical protein